MNILRKSLLSVAVSTALIVAGCSSSNDTSSGIGENPLMQDPATSEGDPENGSTSPIISFESHASVLREIVKIANDDTLNAASDSLDPVFGTVENLIEQAIVNGGSMGNGLTFVSRAAISEGGEVSEYTFSCDSGGTLIARAYRDNSTGGPYVDQFVAEGACSIDDAAYEGSAFRAVRFVRGTDISTFTGFSVSNADGDSLLLDGDYSDTSPEGRGPRVVTGWTDATLRVVENGETTDVSGYTSIRTSVVRSAMPGSEPAGATAEINFTVAAPWSNGEPLDVEIDLAYVDPDDSMPNELGVYSAQWQSGTIRVVAADGTGLTALPDSGDPATFSVTLDGDAGDPIIYNWVDGFQIICATGFDCR